MKNYKELFSVYKNNPDLIYLDNAASALKPDRVTDAVVNYYHNYSSNIERGVYKIAFEATQICEETRKEAAKFINAKSNEVIFTRGCSQSLNMVALSYKKFLNEGDEIITSELEHHSSFLPWLKVSEEKKCVLKFAPHDENGKLLLDGIKELINEKTKVVALNHVSNVLGYINPIKEICEMAHKVGAIVTVDGAQSIPHMMVDVKDLDCDFYSFSFHKMCGPTGIGLLYGKKELLDKMEPVEFGGEMNDEVYLDKVTYKETPYKFETGTMPIAEIFGAREAIKLINEIGYEEIHNISKELKDYCLKEMESIEEIEIYNKESDSPIISFNVKGVHSHDVVTFYADQNVCIRAGHHCAEPLHTWLNISSSLRASFYFYNTKEDVDKFIEVTKSTINFLKEVGYLA